jgi:hypothetical protein
MYLDVASAAFVVVNKTPQAEKHRRQGQLHVRQNKNYTTCNNEHAGADPVCFLSNGIFNR